MVHEQARVGFGRNAESYERGRPGYPRLAIEWLADQLGLRSGRQVLDVGAGTGKLTAELSLTGARVLAIEPVPEMRAVLERTVPEASVLDGSAEALPVEDASIDAITAASAFHWFDGPAALREFHRALRPAARLGLIWNRRRREQPLNAAISEVIEPYRRGAPTHHRGAWRTAFDATNLFEPVDELNVPLEQQLDGDALADRIASISFVGALGDPEREQVIARIRRLTETWPGPLVLSYVTEIYVYARPDR